MIRLFPVVVVLTLGLCFSAVAHEEKDADSANATVKLSDEQVEAGRFGVHDAHPGDLSKRIKVPGSIIPSGDRIARVAVKLLGTVRELRKRLGDSVEAGEVVAVIESREVADANSEYLAARLVFDLQQTLFNRATKLFEGKVLSENNYLRERTTFEDARVKFETARQKLFALNLNAEQIEALPQQPVETLRLQELRAPISGRIAERRVEIGSLVGREGQESELYVIADLGVMWADLAIPTSQLANIQEGQQITISAGTGAEPAPATIMFISPLLDKDTRAARVIASVDNAAGRWRPGAFVTADIPIDQQRADLVVPVTALQSIKGEPVVFVRNKEGFEARKVSVGRRDGRMAEIFSGLTAGERVATFNTFTLKSELGKAEIDHDD
ncbi:efflux RND transporter periplasmic adaptor subunit [Nitrobacter winogradskyi]|uniref:Cytochrome-c peroxidase n=2 Tax=Nitrobacter winogradskyi TaxID=913 RepID=A0A4Y3WA06_NITWI|nr:efflux RND transporter periplasmic adaptor subunit [Nitrobacter winogradskyi]MCP2001389.1 cobalt-zinc-cadmium efflux system membrane fusion protein [Nitrobacter winogradskyi]GEC15435.1 cytochrome-c peroxidase [Nitrobacter winogradskyi]